MATTEGDSEPQYVVVCETEKDGSNRLELPINLEDNTLGLQTLTRAFPNAHGLKFKNPVTNTYRALLTDSSGTRFYQPAGGWQDKLFVIITQQPLQSHSSCQQSQKQQYSGSEKNCENISTNGSKKANIKCDQNAKRRKLMIESDEEEDQSSDSDNGLQCSVADKRLRQSHGAASKQKRLNNDTDGAGSSKDSKKDLSLMETPECTDLIVLGLPFKIMEEEIREYFSQFGGVSFVDIKRKLSGGSKGFGFIRMETFEAQIKVLNKPVHVIGNRKCQVRVPLDKNGEIREDPVMSAKVFVGRLQEKTSTSDLKKFFAEEVKKLSENASVIDVYIPKPFRAFAFVTFSNPAVAEKMIKKGGFMIDGALVSIQSAQPKASSQNVHGSTSPNFARGHYMDDVYCDWYNVPINGNFRNEVFRTNPISRSRMPPHSPFGTGGLNSKQSSKMGANNGHYGSQILASGLETLNLNNIKPELVTALKAIMSAHSNGCNVDDAQTQPSSSMVRGVGGNAISPSPPQRLINSNSNLNGSYMPPMSGMNQHYFPTSSRRSGGNSGGGGMNSGWR